MDLEAWWDGLPAIAKMPAAALAIYAVVILATRLNGLRSFAKMSAFDHAMTIAIGSVIASTILTPNASVAEGAVAVASLFVLQAAVSFARRSRRLERLLDNQPRILVRDGRVLEDSVRRCNLTMRDLRSKVREAGLHSVRDVELAVMETSGTVSIVPAAAGRRIDDDLVEGVT